MPAVRLLSPSKINLHLRIAAPDASGFHPLRTWFVTTGWCDEVGVSIEPASRDSIAIHCDAPGVPTDETNLAARAARAYLDARGTDERFAVAIDLTKRIPTGAGLGGGSSNAATTLIAMRELLPSPVVDIEAIAATLGSDVPFFLRAPSAVATGRGERLVAAPTPAARGVLLMCPAFGVSTPQAYRALDALRPVAPPDALDPFDVDAWAPLPAIELSRRLVNDLEPAAFAIEPRLAKLRDAAERSLGRPVRMSGSGSTLFAVYDDAAEAEAAARLSPADLRPVAVALGLAVPGPAAVTRNFSD